MIYCIVRIHGLHHVCFSVLNLLVEPSHAPSACASAAQAPCSRFVWVMFVVGFMSVLSLFVNCMSFAGQEMCECSTHQIAHPGTQLHSVDYVYDSPRRFARFISSYMIRDAPIYPRHRVLYLSPCEGCRPCY